MRNARITREILDLLNMKAPQNDGIHPGYRQIRVIREEICATSWCELHGGHDPG